MRFWHCIFLLLAGMTYWSCQPAGENAAPTTETVAGGQYQLSDYGIGDVKAAIRTDEEGKVLERGYIENGKKVGTWLLFEDNFIFPSKLISYIDGLHNGPYMEFGNRGQLLLATSYKNNKLHGPWQRYRLGRLEVNANYKDGQLDGTYFEYESRAGTPLKEITYKDGVQDGPMRFFNEIGEITVEYIYKDGEQISGGEIPAGQRKKIELNNK